MNRSVLAAVLVVLALVVGLAPIAAQTPTTAASTTDLDTLIAAAETSTSENAPILKRALEIIKRGFSEAVDLKELDPLDGEMAASREANVPDIKNALRLIRTALAKSVGGASRNDELLTAAKTLEDVLETSPASALAMANLVVSLRKQVDELPNSGAFKKALEEAIKKAAAKNVSPDTNITGRTPGVPSPPGVADDSPDKKQDPTAARAAAKSAAETDIYLELLEERLESIKKRLERIEKLSRPPTTS
jgi:hypothetical protein